jgi:galactokinase
MTRLDVLKNNILNGKAENVLSGLYGNGTILHEQNNRYISLIDRFQKAFLNQSEALFFSTPGRTEIGGNHTDHNAGRILAAAVSLDIVALAAQNTDKCVRIISEGYEPIEINIEDLTPLIEEKFTSKSLVRGVCSRIKMLGYNLSGFDACISGQVPKGSGLSSSAAFEVLIAFIINHFYNNEKIDAIELAKIAQYSENEFFGKPCGLMDQTTCAVGGIVTIDFKDFEKPLVRKVNADFAKAGHRLVIVDTGGNHADLNDDYIALEHEMKSVAKTLGKSVLREIDEEKVMGALALIRDKTGDRAVLRALHFFADDQRVVKQVEALERGNFNHFLQIVTESGESSWMYCQNCFSNKYPHVQGISIGLALSQYVLNGKGAYRVHGGGFAGTIQAFVPLDLVPHYVDELSKVFGIGSCHTISIRTEGAIMVKI